MTSAPSNLDEGCDSTDAGRNFAPLDPEVARGTWVVVPVYNEAKVIGSVLRELAARFPNIVAVDDGSSDGSWDAIRGTAPHAVRHLVNRGQGAALQTGTEYALRRGAARIAHFDADGQHRIEDLERMAALVAGGGCDIALGDRFGGDLSTMPNTRRALVRAAVLFHRVASGIRLNDVHNGLRVLSADAARRMEITADRMAHASELVDLVARSGLRVEQVPVTIRYTDYSLAKGQQWTGGFRILLHYMVAKALGPAR